MRSRLAQIVFILGLMLFLVSPAISGEKTGVTDDTILVGMIGPMTGPLTNVGSCIMNGGNLYFDEVNEAGGINGRKLKIIVGDTQHLPSVSTGTIKKLLERDEVFALWGGSGTNAILPVLPMMIDAKIPFLDVFVSHPSLTDPVQHYIFRAGSIPADVFVRHMVMHALRASRPSKVAIIHESGEYGKYGAQQVEENLNKQKVTLVAKEVYNMGDVDFTSQVVRVKEANPDVIFLYGYSKEAAIILRQAKELGVKGKWIGSDALSERTFAQLVGEVGTGFEALWPWGPYLETSTAQVVVKFVEKYRKKYPMAPTGRPNIYDMVAYASAKVFVEGLTKVGRDLSREGLIKGLESIHNFDSVFLGKVSFSATDHQGNKASRFVRNEAGGERVLLDVTYE